MFGRKMCDHSNGWRPEHGVPDLAMMSDISADAINANLRTRYQRHQIYTYSGSVLIAVNPYKPLDIYGPEWIARFRDQRLLDQSEPHIFALTEAMYMNLVMQDPTGVTKNQACVISGESGAGKTETTKFILSYLCSVTPNKSIWMEHQILEANTILEAFGNAKTVRNDNSSRFGKFIQICFDSKHQINGCIIQDYLLEQSRITYQSIGERNYHVFYQLLQAGQTNQDLRKKFHLMPANFYDYLNKTQCYTIDGIDDCSMFDSLRMAMSVLNMEQDYCDGLFSILSAILWLGNLQFQCDDGSQSEYCTLTKNDIEIIKTVAELLGVSNERLEPIMLRRQISVRGNVTEIPFNIYEAKDNRNGMAKALYSKLFTWVVNFINASTNPGQYNTSFLGVLDIFGFENFDTNSFEQLCINYANEKLHKFFNHHMFAMEQELYRREGIEFCDINYTDNTPCLELLERPPNCILRLLSEECRIPKGSDTTFVEKLHSEFTISCPNPFYIKGNDRRKWSCEFAVKHFAGSVIYSIDGFLKKNKDSQQNQLFDIMEGSTNPLLKDLNNFNNRDLNDSITDNATRLNIMASESIESQSDSSEQVRPKIRTQQSLNSNNHSNIMREIRRESSFSFDAHNRSSNFSSNSSKSRPTVADAFRHQLTSLVELLNSVNPWYVRCIKPNLEKSAIGYDNQQVLLQLKYLGMTDLIRIRREGYPIHLTKHQFVCRYRCLMLKHLRSIPDSSPIKLDEKSLGNYCRKIMDHFDLDKKDWKVGKTMVLLRPNIYQPMEARRDELFIEMTTLIQSHWRGYVQRKHFLMMKSASITIQHSFRAYRGRLLYLRKKRAVLTIQAFVRGMFAREIANALREIKRVEQEKAKQLTQKVIKQESEEPNTIVKTDIIITEAFESDCIESHLQDGENTKHLLDFSTGNNSPVSQQNISPAVSSSASWVAQDTRTLSVNNNKSNNLKDKMEMDELVKVLDRYGISLDALELGNENVQAEFEKLYDVLGNQLQVNYETSSISPSVNDDDRSSFLTSGTNCDGDVVSCSGQSQISSTVTDDNASNEHKEASEQNDDNESISELQKIETPSQILQPPKTFDSSNYQSNSTESIASIISSTSAHSSLQNNDNSVLQTKNDQTNDQLDNQGTLIQAENLVKQVMDNQIRTSTFTGNPILVSGSKMVSNGRPLTRIEEEPNSNVTSPSKTPHKKSKEPTPQSQSLFPPSGDSESKHDDQQQKLNLTAESKKRRLERKILQVQQSQIIQPLNPTTAGLPIHQTNVSQEDKGSVQTEANQKARLQAVKTDSIYDIHKASIIEFAEQAFNNHPKDTTNSVSVIRTLTRRKKSIDTSSQEHMSKADMLSYNSAFSIPTSHFKMHDPHNIQISRSMFKNLCKYMTGDSIKFDIETRIIQSIVRHGIEKIELRDEIYVQIIRQLTNNSNSEYCLRLWILLGIVTAAFSPSKNFIRHVISYIQHKPRKDPSIACYAQFCLDNLQAPRLHARKHPPSPLEIQACKSLTNLTCKIYLLDGRREVISVHPCDTVMDTLTKLAQKINLQSIEGWALYESYTPGASKYPHPNFEQKGDYEKSVRSHTFMADLIASWQDGLDPRRANVNNTLKMAQKRVDEGNFKLTLKKKIFRGPKIRNDPVEISLLYAQAVYNVVKKDCLFVDENLALSLAGIQAQVSHGNLADYAKSDYSSKKDKMGRSTNKSINKSISQLYEIENYICHRLRNQVSRTKKEWCNLIINSHRQFHNSNEVFCKMRYLSMVIYHCPLYGTATFNVTYKGYQTLDQNLMLGVNAEGIVLIRVSDKALINAYRYTDICNDNGISVYPDESIIQLSIKERADNSTKCLTFETCENEEIAMLMVGYQPQLKIYIRGSLSNTISNNLDLSIEQNANKKRAKLKMTLEDRMRTHQEVQNARKAIIKTGKLRKFQVEDNQSGILKHTLKRLSSTRVKIDKPSRFENVYGVISKHKQSELTQTSSDYNLYGSTGNQRLNETTPNELEDDVAGATAATTTDELTKNYPHRYWAYTKFPLKSSLLIIYDPDLEEAALSNFNAILTYSGLISGYNNEGSNGCVDTSSIDSGIASQQSLNNPNSKISGGSPSSASSGDIYDVCPKKMDERDLIKLAQGILDRCLKRDADILKNEFFLQLIKQTTDHPEPNSEINQRHWQLLALSCSVTYPSDGRILAYLYAHLRRCSLDQVTDEGQYAQFTLRSLQGTLDTKGRKYAPSDAEILSTINCRRVYTRVYFLDGQFQAVEFDPCATIAEIVDQIKQKIGLRPDSNGYALFQLLGDDCEQVLQPEEKVGDAIAAWEIWHKQRQARPELTIQTNNSLNNGTHAVTKSSLAALNSSNKSKSHRFIFKKYLFVESLSDLNDPIEKELLYYQTVVSIKEDKFPILEQEATILCALKAQIEIGDYTKMSNLPREHIRMVYKQVIMSLMPPHTFNNLPIPAIAQQHQTFRELSCVDAKKYFFNLIQSFGRADFINNPGYILLHRAHIYDATQTFASAWPSDIWIAINQSGLHMLAPKTRRILASCEYRQIVDYSSSNNYLIVIMVANSQNKLKYTFHTKQAQQIAQQMKDYTVMSSSNGTKRRKSVEFNLRQQNLKQVETRPLPINNTIRC